MYTSFTNIHCKAVFTLENGPSIPIAKIKNFHIMVKKKKKKNSDKIRKNEVPCHEKKEKKMKMTSEKPSIWLPPLLFQKNLHIL